MPKATYRIWCEVSGGVTGHQESWLKDNGKIYETNSKVTAQNKAKRLNATMGKNSSTRFRYSVVKV